MARYRAGTCSGTNNGYTCTLCDNTVCTAANAFRIGTCGGVGQAATTNAYQCKSCLATCAGGQFLKGGCGAETDATCAACKPTCGPGQTRTGACSTASDWGCKDCVAECPTLTYKFGRCTFSSDFTCEPCRNVACAPHQVREGECAGTTDGYTCVDYGGKCENGRLADLTDRRRENHCVSCDAGYNLVGKKGGGGGPALRWICEEVDTTAKVTTAGVPRPASTAAAAATVSTDATPTKQPPGRQGATDLAAVTCTAFFGDQGVVVGGCTPP